MDAKLIRRLSFWSIGATTLVFALAFTSLFIYQRRQIMEEARHEAKNDLYMASNLIGDRLQIAKTAIINSDAPEEQGESRRIVENLLHHNPDIYGTAIALKPEYVRKLCGKDRYMVYSHRTESGKLHTFLISDSIAKYFHYTERDWFRTPLETRTGHWTEPYRDSLTTGALMVTYSSPILLADSTAVGVLMADITLSDGINHIVQEVDSAKNHRIYMLSKQGTLMFGDTTDTAGDIIFTQQLPETGWTLGHVMDKDTLFRPLHKEVFNMSVLFILTILILWLTIYYTISWMTRPAVKRQMRIKAELDVAAHIQAGMLPKTALPFPGREDLDIATVMQPAKEVGGDFYNYFLEDDRLYFIIGDVSGKGVPAALIMAIATELFIVSAPGKTDPAEIMGTINRVISRDNQENMFITMIIGILDLRTHTLTLSNAGHTLPLLLPAAPPASGATATSATPKKEKESVGVGGESAALPHSPSGASPSSSSGVAIGSEGADVSGLRDGEAEVSALELEANIPVGVFGDYQYTSEAFPFPAGSTIVLYTDGVTEAENAHRAQFGEPRLRSTLATATPRPATASAPQAASAPAPRAASVPAPQAASVSSPQAASSSAPRASSSAPQAASESVPVPGASAPGSQAARKAEQMKAAITEAGKAEQLKAAIEGAIREFTAGQEQSDDITLFILHLLPSPK